MPRDPRHPLRSLAEQVLLEETGGTRVVRLCRWCGSDAHGRPVVVGASASVSIAYADRLVAVAWAPTGPVGIDVEGLGADRQEWTRIEALLKATGEGLRGWPDVPLPDLPTHSLELPDGYVGTVVGEDVSWRLAGPAAPDRPATR